MSYFSTANTTYIDACLGVSLPSWEAVHSTFASAFASAPASAISYPLRIVGDTGSAAVELVDTPDFFVPQELRALSSVTFDSNHKIIRWVDYWDGRSSLTQNTIASAAISVLRENKPIPERIGSVISSAAGTRPSIPTLSWGQACTQSRQKVQSMLPTLSS